MMMQLGRRKLLKLGVAGGAVAGTTGAVAWFQRETIVKLQAGDLAAYLKSNFDYLTFNFGDEALLEFAEQYRKHYRTISRKWWYVLRDGNADEHSEFMDHFATTFLLSTDFFMHGADESRPVNYVMFYHPYLSPCWNPISMRGGSA